MNQGEVIQLGRHRLMCGDAFNPEHVDALMQCVKPDMLYCDPPYGMGLQADWSTAGKDTPFKGMTRGNRYENVLNDDVPFDPSVIIERFTRCPEQFWWGADYYAERILGRNAGCFLAWDKRLTESMNRIFGSCFELCWSRKRHKRDVIRIRWTGFFGTEQEPERRRLHPTQKPIALAEWFISRYSKPDDVVLDLFGGAGGTLLACERLGRTCYMAEISPDYCDVIIQRYEQMTQQPKLLEVG